jgi:hypothetical protein
MAISCEAEEGPTDLDTSAPSRTGQSPDTGVATLHVRCGSDLLPLLQAAGFVADYLEVSDPLCQGPVLTGHDWLTHRARFLTNAYGAFLDRSFEEISKGLHRANQDLATAAQRYERVVLWFEHDSYDQLILARCLAQFALTPPRSMELVQVDHHPGPARFIGLGQLPPEAFPSLWDQRQPVSEAQLEVGTRVWEMLRAVDPTALADAARTGIPQLPFMANAVRRHCQEFPWIEDGLSLTQRLVLQLLAERPCTMGEIFRDLMADREPLPWLGDTMLRFILDSMKRIDQPVFTAASDDGDQPWYRERLTITDLGRAVLSGTVDFLSLHPPDRFLGGVPIGVAGPDWRWDDRTGAMVAV